MHLLFIYVLLKLWCSCLTDHRKVVSSEKLSEKYKNATATLMVLEDKANGKRFLRFSCLLQQLAVVLYVGLTPLARGSKLHAVLNS